MRQLSEESLLCADLSESAVLGDGVGASWVGNFAAVLRTFGALPDDGLCDDGVPRLSHTPQLLPCLTVGSTAAGMTCPIPSMTPAPLALASSTVASTNRGLLSGGSDVELLQCFSRGRWTDVPVYVLQRPACHVSVSGLWLALG